MNREHHSSNLPTAAENNASERVGVLLKVPVTHIRVAGAQHGYRHLNATLAASGHLPQIFDRFWRGRHGALTSGSGIGLAVAADDMAWLLVVTAGFFETGFAVLLKQSHGLAGSWSRSVSFWPG
jgi:hypothetical protein